MRRTSPRPPIRNRFHAASTLVISILLCGIASSCAFAGGPELSVIAERVNATLSTSPESIGPGDQLEVGFAYSPSWNQSVLVPRDGVVSFLGLDAMQVNGLTTEELDQRLTSAYTPLLDNPNLSVEIVTPAPHYVSVLGEVHEPGEIVFPSDRRLTLVEALARAGSYKKETAYLASTVLIRWDAKQKRQLAWTIDARPDTWHQSNTVFLQPDDILFVPNTPIDDVGIWVDNFIRRLIPLPLFPLV